MPVVNLKELPANNLHKGDIIRKVESNAIVSGKRAVGAAPIVNDVTHRTKNIELDTDHGTVLLRAHALVTIEREEPTEDELEAKRQEYIRQVNLDSLRDVRRRQTKLVDEFIAGHDSPWGYKVLDVAVESIELRAKERILSHVAWLMGDEKDSEGDLIDEPLSPIDAVKRGQEYCEEQVFRSSAVRATSRSTSVTSNLAEDVELEVFATGTSSSPYVSWLKAGY